MRAEIKFAAAAVIAVVGSTVAAQAQSMVAPVVTSNMYQPSYSAWDGFYVGAQGSLIGMKSHEIAPGILVGEQLLGDIGGSAGVFAGYRYQLSDWFVLGVDAEVNNVATQFEFNGAQNYGALKWDAAVRATLGYPVAPNVLAYGTVGYSWGRFDFTPSRGGVAAAFTAGGFQLGLGVDMMITQNLMARLNATWTHYGVNNVPGGGTSEPSNQVVRAGLAWKF
ncbi:outer membrane beta-barrel protein [Devosia sp.]|uniref:outer membrane protein n=1 Tax=Devosia sp. TaxID=1871048 RepID=UPI0019DCFBDE|nr:outer membrane beta-barrel protein [Devosia sp.]MBE0581069.1 porin family protein [Devosia sp.]